MKTGWVSRAALGLTVPFLVSAHATAGCGDSNATSQNIGGSAPHAGGNAGGASPSGGSGGSGPMATGGGAASGGGGLAGSTSGGSAGISGQVGTGAAGAGGAAGGSGGTASGGASGSDPVGGTAGVTGGSAGEGGVAAAGAGGTGGSAACVDVPELETWPSKAQEPSDVAARAVANFKNHTGDMCSGDCYALFLAWQASLRITSFTGNTQLNSALIADFAPFLNGTRTMPNNPPTPGNPGVNVDNRIFGVLPLQIYLQTGDARYQELGLARADMQWENAGSDGITSDARYWIDDMYMITALQVMAYRATKDTKYLERATRTMLAYIAKLQKNPDDTPGSLFWHINADGYYKSRAYWGRANGWVAAGMTEMLLELPAGDERNQIMAAYEKQMAALLPLQITNGADEGCWRQVLDRSDAPAETSSTSMFTFALVTGVRNGWLTGGDYVQAARKGWLGLAAKANNDTGELARVSPGTGAPKESGVAENDLAGQQQFYIDRMKDSYIGDQHGQAALMWAAFSLMTDECPGVR